MRPGLFAAVLISLAWNAQAADQGDTYDFFTVQTMGNGAWSPDGAGFNLSRYHWSDWPTDDLSIMPGYGIRGKVGSSKSLELLAKLSLTGIVGASTGPYLSDDGYGMAATFWYGSGLIGLEQTFYWGGGERESEKGLYLAIHFGTGSDGGYSFENWLLELVKM